MDFTIIEMVSPGPDITPEMANSFNAGFTIVMVFVAVSISIAIIVRILTRT